MKNIFRKITATVVTSAALSVAMAAGANNPAQAIDFDYSFKGDTGYSATGSFSYDETTAPAIISEAGSGPTNFLKSLSLSVFDPSGTLLDSGSSVVNGVSNDSFLQFQFDTQAQKLTVLDNTTPDAEISYFLSNAVDTSGNPVTPGSTSFKLFQFTNSTTTYNVLGSAPSVQVSKAASVPEPASVLGVLAVGVAGVALRKKAASQNA